MEGLKVTAVASRSTASEIGIEPGDSILSINGREVADCLSYRYLIAAEDVGILLRKKDGSLFEIEIEKDGDDDLGIDSAPMRVRRCGNRCVFCFVAQTPEGLRRALYVKDEDYRHSFLYGNYITLTTLRDEDYERIIYERLSPLYVSVHATDDGVRRLLLGNRKAPPVMDGIRRLTGGGITLHAQAVVCPGMNDGERLVRTMDDLAALYPGVASLAVVPVGLTRHRAGLYPLRGFTKRGAAMLLDMVEPYRRRFRKRFGESFVYPSDELYIKAGRELPPAREYDGYPQMANGVGLVRDFLDEFKRTIRRKGPAFFLQKESNKENGTKTIILVTGVSFAPYLREAAKVLSESGVSVRLLPVKNGLFGHTVTVAGLLAGRDIANALKGKKADRALIPSVATRDGDGVFLDGMTPEEVEREAGIKVTMVEPTAGGLVEALAGKQVKKDKRRGVLPAQC